MSATAQERPAHFGPIAGGADREARYEAAVVATRQRFDRRRRDLGAARAREEAAIADKNRTFVERWGDFDGDRRRIDDRLHFEKTALPAHHQACIVHRNAITNIDAELQQLPREEAAAVARLGANLIDGPDITVPAFVPPSLEEDGALREMQAQRGVAITAREALYIDRDALYGIVAEADRHLATLADKVKYGLASKADQTTARKAAADAQARHQHAIANIDELTAEIDGLDRRIAERTAIVQREQDHRVAREVEEALHTAADAMVPTMQAMTRLRRAIAMTDGDTWTVKALNLDEPRSVGRAFLQQAMEAGWLPKETA